MFRVQGLGWFRVYRVLYTTILSHGCVPSKGIGLQWPTSTTIFLHRQVLRI